jgi:hypothetical protein
VDLAERAVRATSAAHEDLLRHLPPQLTETATSVLREVSDAIEG